MTLLPCPFCGGSNVRLVRGFFGRRCVLCDGCGAEGPWILEDADKARSLWNQRQPGRPDPEARSQGAADALRDVSGWLDAAGVPPAPRGLHGSVEQVQARIAALREAAEIVRGGGGG